MTATRAAAALLLALGGIGVAQAQAQATVEPDGRFRSVFGLGASHSAGNSDMTNVSLTGDAVRAADGDKTTLYGNLQYARSEGVTTAEQYRLGGRQDRDLSRDYFVFGGLDLDRNRFTNLQIRGHLNGGLGWHLVKSPTTTFDVFGGLGYTSERYFDAMLIDGRTRRSYGYLGLLLGEESTHALSVTATARQRLTAIPNLENRGEWRVNWDAGLAVKMTTSFSLTVGITVAYNSEPGPGRKSTDTLLTTGVAVRFD